MSRLPCHVCLRIVAHYDVGGKPNIGWRGSVPHKCPHGQQCRGGDRLFRWGHMGYAPNCRECSIILRVRNDENTMDYVERVNGVAATVAMLGRQS